MVLLGFTRDKPIPVRGRALLAPPLQNDDLPENETALSAMLV